MSADDEMWTPSRPGDEARDNPRVIANRLDAVQRDLNDGFDRIGRTLERLVRIDEKIDVLIDRQNVIERRQDAQDAALAELGQRLAALEKPTVPAARAVTRRKPRRK